MKFINYKVKQTSLSITFDIQLQKDNESEKEVFKLLSKQRKYKADKTKFLEEFFAWVGRQYFFQDVFFDEVIKGDCIHHLRVKLFLEG